MKHPQHYLPGLKINVSMNANDFLFASIHEVLEDIDGGIYSGVYRSIYLLAGFAFYLDSDHCYSGSPYRYILVLLSLIGFSLNLLTLVLLCLPSRLWSMMRSSLSRVSMLARSGIYIGPSGIYRCDERIGWCYRLHYIGHDVRVYSGKFHGWYGRYVLSPFGLTMAIAIGLSALNALTLSPALCAVIPETTYGT